MNSFFQDVRYAWRMFLRSPSAYVMLVVVLALGIAGATAMFTVVNGVLLRPLPFPEPQRLIKLTGTVYNQLSLWASASSVEKITVSHSGGANLHYGQHSERISAAIVTGDFFEVFGVAPRLGRLIRPDETQAGGCGVVISDVLWQRAFGASAQVLGRAIRLDSVSCTVTGVMPRGFSFPGRTHIWVPEHGGRFYLGADEQRDLPGSLRHSMVARLRPGATVEQARQEIFTLNERLTESYRGSNQRGSTTSVSPLLRTYTRQYENALLAVLCAAAFLLLIACINAASLLLARAAVRQKEMAVRCCLGAPRGRILRQLLTESVLLSAVAGLTGSFLAYWLVEMIRAFGPADMPRLAEVRVDAPALLLALGISIGVGIFVGLAPALQTFAKDLAAALKVDGSSSAGAIRQRARGVLVVSEIAIAVVLLTGAGLALRSLFLLNRVPTGFDAESVITMTVALAKPVETASADSRRDARVGNIRPGPRVTVDSSGRVLQNWRRILENAAAIPGVITAGAIGQLPLGGEAYSLSLKFGEGQYGMGGVNYIGGEYFRAMGIPLLAGRNFAPSDAEDSAKVVIVSRSLARRVWGDRNPVGELLVIEGEDYREGGGRQVIGVVEDVRRVTPEHDDSPQFYLPVSQPFLGRAPSTSLHLVARVAGDDGDGSGVAAAIRSRVLDTSADAAVFNVRQMQDVVAESTATRRFSGQVLAGFAGAALLIAVFGIYGLLAHAVARRTREFGVRMALGAQPSQVLLLVLREGARLALAGIALGLLGASWLSQYVSSLLYGIGPRDAWSFSAAALLLFATALAASLFPAAKAGRCSPAEALRYE